MRNINYLLNEVIYPVARPNWFPTEIQPEIITDWSPYSNLRFDITENICGLDLTFGFVKIGVLRNFITYNHNTIYQSWEFNKVRKALADILKYYSAETVVLQAKYLEKDNYYRIMPKILAYRLYIDGIEQTICDMARLLFPYNIEVVPIIALKRQINEKTKEKYSANSLLANIPNKGLICTNKTKSLSFLL